MKKSILWALLFAPFFVSGQVIVNGIDINEIEGLPYLQMTVVRKGMSNYQLVTIDYGQNVKDNKSDKILGADGEEIKFNSSIHALQVMDQNGWEVADFSVTGSGQSFPVFYYLLKRKE